MGRKSLSALFSAVLIMTLIAGFNRPSMAYAANESLVSGITVQNLSTTSAATVIIEFYDASGNLVKSYSGFTIPANSQRTWYVPSAFPDLPSPFVGSAVVSSDQPVAAIVNTQAPYPGSGTSPSDPFRVDTYSGVNPYSTGTKAYLTQVMKEYYGWNSHFAVQNATTSNASASVTVDFIDENTGQAVAAAHQVVSIAANASHLFTQKDNANLPNGFSGGVVISSDQPVAVTASFFNADTSDSTSQFHSYNGFTSGSTKVYVPRLVRKYYGYNSGLRVQNVDASGTANVTITYNFKGTLVTKNMTLTPGQAKGVYLGDDNANTSGIPEGNVNGVGSAVIASNVPIVATANEDNRSMGRGTTYNAFLDGQQTKNIFFPQVTAKYYSYCSGIQVQNVTDQLATGTATFTMAGRAPVTVNISIQPNSSWQIFAPDALGGAGDFNGAVSVTLNQNAVGIANMSVRNDVDPRTVVYGDTFTAYNGLNQ